MRFTITSVVAATCLAALAECHSWVEELNVATNGSFVGKKGYIRGHVARTGSGFNDMMMTHRLPPEDRPVDVGMQPSDFMCMPSQRRQRQSGGFPMLEAAPGDIVALMLQENGHVTLPDTQPGKPENRGTVYIYGTQDPRQDEKFLDVHGVWGAGGSGGDGRGRLLASQDFDDGRCYQVNGDKISQSRQQQYPHEPDELTGADLACQHYFPVPKDIKQGSILTGYWVWIWPTAAGIDPNLPNGKDEIYTSCFDIKIVASGGYNGTNSTNGTSGKHSSGAPPLNRMPIASLLANLKNSSGTGHSDVSDGTKSGSKPPAKGSIVHTPRAATTATWETKTRTSPYEPTHHYLGES
ncbi:uncharacterized protein GIQ15_03234 [Arthroderma uncinatum]|uniref:uncharacterized protein n=1 Tax=Arthroderma uncinatum TaxID=74035 RepID=UPI00144A56A6|nr:uncharacterized protein GIQ15_03234 [Arthroderma uncinatum]KAF3483910.1 hypothetical protein GIQ15_03234 [Arthroderma uncinatum]